MREPLHITLSTFNRRIRCKGIPLWASDHLLNELLHPVFFDGTNEKQVEVNTDWSFSRSLCAVLWERLGGKSVRLCSTAKPLQQEPQSELQVSAALIPMSPRAAGATPPVTCCRLGCAQVSFSPSLVSGVWVRSRDRFTQPYFNAPFLPRVWAEGISWKHILLQSSFQRKAQPDFNLEPPLAEDPAKSRPPPDPEKL